jgi:hypothetical protein
MKPLQVHRIREINNFKDMKADRRLSSPSGTTSALELPRRDTNAPILKELLIQESLGLWDPLSGKILMDG